MPGIEGIDAGSTKLYQKMKVKSHKLLQAILNVAVEVKNYNLTPDRIVYEMMGLICTLVLSVCSAWYQIFTISEKIGADLTDHRKISRVRAVYFIWSIMRMIPM